MLAFYVYDQAGKPKAEVNRSTGPQSSWEPLLLMTRFHFSRAQGAQPGSCCKDSERRRTQPFGTCPERFFQIAVPQVSKRLRDAFLLEDWDSVLESALQWLDVIPVHGLHIVTQRSQQGCAVG